MSINESQLKVKNAIIAALGMDSASSSMEVLQEVIAYTKNTKSSSIATELSGLFSKRDLTPNNIIDSVFPLLSDENVKILNGFAPEQVRLVDTIMYLLLSMVMELISVFGEADARAGVFTSVELQRLFDQAKLN